MIFVILLALLAVSSWAITRIAGEEPEHYDGGWL